jgi:RNA polymerase sigma-70 factor (family 1)
MLEENDLITDLKNGKASALNTLFRQYYAPLCLFATRLTKDAAASEDIVGETFVKFWSKHGNFESEDNIKAFLYISVRNACLNFIKQLQRAAVTQKQMAYLAEEKEGFVLNEMVRAEVVKEIMTEIDKLPAQCQKIFKMSYLEGLKNDEIAVLMRISIHTVRNQKIRALQLLKTKFVGRNLLQLYFLLFPVCRYLLG